MNKVFASIITIGDELLIGQVIDTNSAFISQELNKIGVWMKHRMAVGDDWDDIWEALEESAKVSDIILITGGLGPTADDITKPLLNKYFGGQMIVHEETLEHIKKIFASPELAKQISVKAAENAKFMHDKESAVQYVLNIYRKLLT